MPWPFSKKKQPLHTPVVELPTHPEGVVLPAMTNDRRYLKEVPYILPKDLEEINRLDFQHYALRASLKSNHMAQLDNPRTILDVGSGTGQWCYEICAEFPDALVTGFDLEAGKAANVGNYQFVSGNVLDGLPFADSSFDYVHQRLLVTALPLTAWPVEVRELARVTHFGGWVELLESGREIAPVGPATNRLFDFTGQLTAIRGLDTTGVVTTSLPDYLRQAGLQRIETGYIDVPLGQWGGRLGALMSTNFGSTFRSMRGLLEARFHLPGKEFDQLLSTVQREWEQYHTLYRFRYAYGQKYS